MAIFEKVEKVEKSLILLRLKLPFHNGRVEKSLILLLLTNNTQSLYLSL